jgi:sulfur carrier protein
MITVRVEPQNRVMHLPKSTSVLQLLRKLELGPNSALVIRGQELLTPDRRLLPGDEITVRPVGSRG